MTLYDCEYIYIYILCQCDYDDLLLVSSCISCHIDICNDRSTDILQ